MTKHPPTSRPPKPPDSARYMGRPRHHLARSFQQVLAAGVLRSLKGLLPSCGRRPRLSSSAATSEFLPAQPRCGRESAKPRKPQRTAMHRHASNRTNSRLWRPYRSPAIPFASSPAAFALLLCSRRLRSHLRKSPTPAHRNPPVRGLCRCRPLPSHAGWAAEGLKSPRHRLSLERGRVCLPGQGPAARNAGRRPERRHLSASCRSPIHHPS